jgi:hypothetical protein
LIAMDEIARNGAVVTDDLHLRLLGVPELR